MRENPISKAIIVQAAVEKALFSFDRLYSYVVPDGLRGIVKAGMRVLIPFGRGSKTLAGMVFEVAEEESEYDPKTVKSIIGVADEEPVLNAEMLKIAVWLKGNTFCTYYDAVKCVLPPDMRVIRNFETDGNCKAGNKTERIVKLAEDFCNDGGDAAESSNGLTPKQKAVISALESGAASVREVCYLCNVTPAVVNNLVRKGVLEEHLLEINRAVTADLKATENLSSLVFSDEQRRVFDGLSALMDKGEAKCALLRGVTSSGKTSVFIKLIERVTARGKTAIMLVPEISLTPQTIANFAAYFGKSLALIHSNLSMGQRADEYKRIRSGEARIVIGTRSAVFAPLEDIGIVVIDEEGEHTYKSERSPRYHARDVAKQRCLYHNALLLLASATPSLESYHKAVTGKYALFELTERYNGTNLPDVYIVDMKIEAEAGNTSNFSQALLNELKANLERGEQSLILLNRRGYHTYVCCIACGNVEMCPNCAVPLTYHKANENITCHYCGFTRVSGNRCGSCGSRYIKQSGTGTQRVEDELNRLFPQARILRMDADTTLTKGAYERGFGAFGGGEYDIMVGTQMIAKGLDFENVTLVGVLAIDKALYAGDYLGYETTFSLITQVVGRSGRGSRKGRAYLQTYTPAHHVLRLAARQDYTGFYAEEAEIRKALLFPPFCDICEVEFAALEESAAREAAALFIPLFKDKLDASGKTLPVRLLGPVKSGAGSINGRFRYRLVIKCRNSRAFRGITAETLKTALADKRFRFVRINAYFE